MDVQKTLLGLLFRKKNFKWPKKREDGSDFIFVPTKIAAARSTFSKMFEQTESFEKFFGILLKICSKTFKNFFVEEKDMELASSEAVFMHCLPAHRGEEISFSMLEHDKSVVWQQAENRLHVQQSLLEFLLVN